MTGTPASCPLCGSGHTARTTRFGEGPWTLWSCEGCSTLFVSPAPDPAELRTYYEYAAYAAPGYVRPSWRNRRAVARMGRLLEEIERAGSRRGTLLDVGCSVGSLLLAGRDRGWVGRGIEVDPETARVAQRRSACPVLVGAGLEGLGPADRFDLITMNHWLEHTTDPGRQLKMARAHLAPGGRMLIRVPNVQSYAARWLREWWNWYQPPVHLSYFAPASFRTVASMLDLTVDRLEGRQGDASHLLIELVTGRARALISERRRPGPPGSDRFTPRAPRISRPALQLLRTAVEVGSDVAEVALPVGSWDDSEILCVLRDAR